MAQKRLFSYKIRDIFEKNAAFFSNEWLSKTIIEKKYGVIFSPNPDSPAAYRGNDHLEKPRDSRSPGGGGASGGMDARDLVKAAEKVLLIA